MHSGRTNHRATTKISSVAYATRIGRTFFYCFLFVFSLENAIAIINCHCGNSWTGNLFRIGYSTTT